MDLPRIDFFGWDIEKISSVRIELTSPDDETEIQTFNAKQDIDTIISFLKMLILESLTVIVSILKNN